MVVVVRCRGWCGCRPQWCHSSHRCSAEVVVVVELAVAVGAAVVVLDVAVGLVIVGWSENGSRYPEQAQRCEPLDPCARPAGRASQPP